MDDKIFDIKGSREDDKDIIVEYTVNVFESRQGGRDRFAYIILDKSDKKPHAVK